MAGNNESAENALVMWVSLRRPTNYQTEQTALYNSAIWLFWHKS